MRIRLESIGCRLNEAELQLWARQFQALGHQPSTDDPAADLVVVNTCAVTQEAVRKSRQLLRRVQRRNPLARLVVSGCAAELSGTEIDLTGVDLLVTNRHKDQLVDIARRALELPAMPDSADSAIANPLFARGRQRAFVKIQDGCRYQCTFCVTTIARGSERSRPLPDIVAEIHAATASGVQEAVLTGVHAAGYGAELGYGLTDLIQAVLEQTEIPRLRLGSVEPWGLDDKFWRLFENPRLAPHLHLPLQSGSDTVLRRMGRRCHTGHYQRLVERARHEIADFNLTTDIIVGFPGETDADWQETRDVVARIGFSHLHIFSYSRRPGTLAATMPNQVSPEIKRIRTSQLQKLAARLKTEALIRHQGRRMEVLFESGLAAAAGAAPFGYTLNYLPVRLQTQSADRSISEPLDWTNRIVPVTLNRLSPDGDVLLATPNISNEPSSADQNRLQPESRSPG